ncbi:MAG: rod shape-determining protein RodA [Rickettsiales bacterium]|jgi:rod shape determining protein RodA|nr:rod shape-determining protein RodA [Rickettsiales bacterium]
MANSVRVQRAENLSIAEKLSRISWGLFLLMSLVLVASVITLYSIGNAPCADQAKCVYEFGSWRPWALPQLLRIGLGMCVFFVAALANIKFLIRFSYFIFAVVIVMILFVALWGHTGMGAQRWINMFFFNVQPSELIKIALIMTLARYFSWLNSVEVSQFKNYILSFLMVLVPFVLVVMQPDLGTALAMVIIAVFMFYIIGMPRIWFAVAVVVSLVAAPVLWNTALRDYQKDRILTMLNPGKDLKGKGYQINQSKITIGSGGFLGKGLGRSDSQANLNFLPEKHTDFIFAVYAEKFGFLGALVLIVIYLSMTLMIYGISKNSRNRFGQLFCFGFMTSFFVYYFINLAMVMGIMPIVGMPLPLMSYGGSSLIALLFGFGLVQNANIHKDMQLSSKGN